MIMSQTVREKVLIEKKFRYSYVGLEMKSQDEKQEMKRKGKRAFY